MDQASLAILNRHFSPLSIRVKSPSDLLDAVGYPKLTIRNLVTPSSSSSSSPPPSSLPPQPARLVEKTLIEQQPLIHEEELYRLNKKLIEFEHERNIWQQKLNAYRLREERLRKMIEDNQAEINQLLYTNQSDTEYSEEEDDDDDVYYYYPHYYYYYSYPYHDSYY
ncbi:hypothetical protein G6F43_003248 [Rhizopus delemar]|nr:hypothetical protein G6F43_003248 [Rhizopus delemar]